MAVIDFVVAVVAVVLVLAVSVGPYLTSIYGSVNENEIKLIIGWNVGWKGFSLLEVDVN